MCLPHIKVQASKDGRDLFADIRRSRGGLVVLSRPFSFMRRRAMGKMSDPLVKLLDSAKDDAVFLVWLEHWLAWRTELARKSQLCLLSEQEDKIGHLFLAGRGFGKTRIGAEETLAYAMLRPGSRQHIIAPTASDVKSVCVEGESGIFTICPDAAKPKWNRSMGELDFYNGSVIRCFSAEEPQRLRGPQCERIWADELAAWGGGSANDDKLEKKRKENASRAMREAWDMAMFGLRLGKRATWIATTTPKGMPLIKELVGDPSVIVTRGSTHENKENLAPSFFAAISKYEGTSLGRQEIHAEILDLSDQGILKRSWFKIWPAGEPFPVFEYVVLSYDTGYTEKTHNDPTACTVWGVFKDKQRGDACVMLIDCWRDHLGYPDLRKRVLVDWHGHYGSVDPAVERHFSHTNRLARGRQPDICLIEDKGSGSDLLRDLQREGVNCRAYNPGRADKINRVHVVSPLVASGRVWLPESDRSSGAVKAWAQEALDEWCGFPGGTEHDDYTDTLSQMLRLLQDGDLLSMPPRPPDLDDRDDDNVVPIRKGNYYAN